MFSYGSNKHIPTLRRSAEAGMAMGTSPSYNKSIGKEAVSVKYTASWTILRDTAIINWGIVCSNPAVSGNAVSDPENTKGVRVSSDGSFSASTKMTLRLNGEETDGSADLSVSQGHGTITRS